jgi:hypothetical protein
MKPAIAKKVSSTERSPVSPRGCEVAKNKAAATSWVTAAKPKHE